MKFTFVVLRFKFSNIKKKFFIILKNKNMKTKLLFVLLLIGIILNSCTKDSPADSSTSYDDEILNLINIHRKELNLSELVKNDIIWNQAKIHSSNMAKGTVEFGHDGFQDRIDILEKEIGNYAKGAENVAAGQNSAQSVVNSWLNSPGHKANIEGDYNLTGLSAIKAEDGTWYYTQIFYKKN